MGFSIWQLIIVFFMLIIGVLPWVMALASKKVNGTKKILWFILSFVFSWLGYFIYYYLVIDKTQTEIPEFIEHTDNPNRQNPY